MIVDGNAIVRELCATLQQRVKTMQSTIRLGLVIAEETPVIHSFVERKVRFGREIGVEVGIEILDPLRRTTTQDLLHSILYASRSYDGLVLQLPVPFRYDLDSVLRLFPLSHDVDVLGVTAYQQFKEHTLPFLPPVVGAMAEILHRENVRIAGMHVLVIGDGRLVGAPASVWAKHLGATVKTVTKETPQVEVLMQDADVIISGAGAPGLIRPELIKEGVIILDAGTSEQEGVLKGDADPACADKARIFTPTPGGIGPITVAKVFENLLTLVALKEGR